MTAITIEEVRRLAKQLTPAEQLRLAEELKREAGAVGRGEGLACAPRDLRGDWKGKFPEDIDIEADLREIRTAWKRKFDDA